MSEPILIGGEWKAGRGPDMVSVYPADGSENAVVAGASAADVDEAVARKGGDGGACMARYETA